MVVKTQTFGEQFWVLVCEISSSLLPGECRNIKANLCHQGVINEEFTNMCP